MDKFFDDERRLCHSPPKDLSRNSFASETLFGGVEDCRWVGEKLAYVSAAGF
jgi:hypothetical protein